MTVVAAHLWKSGVSGLSLLLPRRLAGEGRLAPVSHQPPPDDGKPSNIVGVHYQCAEVTPDSFADAPIHLSHYGYGTVLCLFPIVENSGHSGYDPNVSSAVLDLSPDDSKAARIAGLLHPASETCQIAHVGSAMGYKVPVGTAPGESVRWYLGFKEHLPWWLQDRNWVSGRPLSLPHPDMKVVTDASLLGWGGHLGEVEIRGLWSLAETRLHMNLLALWAIHLLLKAILPTIGGRMVHVLMDNATAMRYCNKKVGWGPGSCASGSGWTIRRILWW